MSGERNPIRHQLGIYGPAALLVLAAFVLAYQFIKPAPPSRVVMATGGVDGAYHAFAQRYAAFLAREGITLELRPTAGSLENLGQLRSGEAALALIQQDRLRPTPVGDFDGHVAGLAGHKRIVGRVADSQPVET